MKKVGVLIADLYNEFEVIYPYYRLKEAGYEVVLIGPEAKDYHSKAGLLMKAEAKSAEVDPKELAGILIPGGFAPDFMRRDPATIALVKRVYESGKPVAAICHAGWVIISAGIVKGKRVTGFIAVKDDLINAGGEYLDEPLVVDGNLITSRKPEDLPLFMKEFLKQLAE
ncbi:MAG: type 1 glutamine amidotransferase domain-containing protein [Coprothermobacterota bacterium]|jgi:protease I|nr:type 1 glutamine amidotransferase [Caldisericota bacterium]MDI6868728.1 type 1 glutamine amidotransferase domain-containing protein [Coprothermobacterota bacterium]